MSTATLFNPPETRWACRWCTVPGPHVHVWDLPEDVVALTPAPSRGDEPADDRDADRGMGFGLLLCVTAAAVFGWAVRGWW